MNSIPDVSYYQYGWNEAVTQITKYINFEAMRQKTSAVIIRAGQRNYKDIAFDVSWKNAKAAGLYRSAYFFYDSRATPQAQAEKWVEILNGDLGELPLWCDFEERYGGAYGSWKHWYDFIERLKILVPNKEIGIYTGYFYWLEKTIQAGIPAASLEYFKQYILWIANYKVEKPLVPKPWTDWTFWQFTAHGNGLAYGVESKNIDLNYFNGDEAAFRKRFGLGNTPSSDGNKPSSLFTFTNGIERKYTGA